MKIVIISGAAGSGKSRALRKLAGDFPITTADRLVAALKADRIDTTTKMWETKDLGLCAFIDEASEEHIEYLKAYAANAIDEERAQATIYVVRRG